MNIVISVVLRHFLAAVGVSGVLSDDQLRQAVGAVTTLGMIAWSLWSKRDQIAATWKTL